MSACKPDHWVLYSMALGELSKLHVLVTRTATGPVECLGYRVLVQEPLGVGESIYAVQRVDTGAVVSTARNAAGLGRFFKAAKLALDLQAYVHAHPQP